MRPLFVNAALILSKVENFNENTRTQINKKLQGKWNYLSVRLGVHIVKSQFSRQCVDY